MSSLADCVGAIAVLIIGAIVYVMVMSIVIPKSLRLRYTDCESFDRGIKKYRYVQGRAVTYEPRPSMRKYIPMYALFTHNGYKYIRCKTDLSVWKLSYQIVMFDNEDRVIDTVTVTEQLAKLGETAAVMLHADTSYVSLELASVNEHRLQTTQKLVCPWQSVALYTGLNVLATFLEMVAFVLSMQGLLVSLALGDVVNAVNVGYLFISSLVLGLAVSAWTIRSHYAKGIKVMWHAKQL